LPEFPKDDNPIKDVGLRGEVLTGENSDSENDLIRYSNYISGAGSTFGGFMSGFPQDTKDMVSGRGAYLYILYLSRSALADLVDCYCELRLLSLQLRSNENLA